MHPVEKYRNYNLYRGWVVWVQLWCPQEEGGVELLYNSVKTGDQFEDHTSWRQDAVEKASTQQSGPSGPRLNSCSWGSYELEIRCWNENIFQRGWTPRPLFEQPRRTGKKRGYGQWSGGQYVTVLFSLQLLLTHNPFK